MGKPLTKIFKGFSADTPIPEDIPPWRAFDWGQKEKLKNDLENFSPSHPEVNQINILLVGQVGAGKSSFINTIDSAFRERIVGRALAHSAESGHSFTQNLRGFSIRSKTKTLSITIKDVMGLEPDVLAGSQSEDLIKALLGHVKDGYKFDRKEPIPLEDQHYTQDPGLSDQCFCLVYVIDANTVKLIDDRLVDKLKIIRQKISTKGIPQVIVLTKVDEACPLVNKNLNKVYNSKKIKDTIEMCHNKLGMPKSNIFPVKNYHDEIETNDAVDLLALKALQQIVNSADDRLVDNDCY